MAASASRPGGGSCLLAAPLEICGSTISATRPVPVVDDAYPYPYTTRSEDFYPIDYIGMGDSHNPTSSKSHIDPNGNCTGELWVPGRVGSGHPGRVGSQWRWRTQGRRQGGRVMGCFDTPQLRSSAKL